MLAFGTEERHVEMRVRLVVEMVVNSKLYLSPAFLSRGSSDDGQDILEKLKRYAEVYNVSHSAKTSFAQENFLTRNASKECGMWHLFAAANILHSKVISVFPDKGEGDMRSLAKRTILPKRDQSATSKFIMWTSHREDLTDEHWVPNHFVPLLPLHPSSDEPSVVVEEEDISDTLNTGFLFER